MIRANETLYDTIKAEDNHTYYIYRAGSQWRVRMAARGYQILVAADMKSVKACRQFIFERAMVDD